MSDIIVFLFFNILFLTSLFWIISICSEYFFKKKQQQLKRDFYECGFTSQFKLNLSLNINFIFILSLFLLYDSELLLFLPTIINYFFLNIIFFFIYIYVIIIFFISFFYDEINNSFYWIV